MNPKPGSRYLSGKYISGHPGINSPVEKTTIAFTAQGLVIQNGTRAAIALIPPDQIKNVSVEDASTVQSRVTATRLLALGVFAFAAKKKQMTTDFYLTIKWNDGRFDHETIFEFTDTNANAQANTLRNAIIGFCQQSPEDRQAAFDKIEAEKQAAAAKKQADAQARSAMLAAQQANVKKTNPLVWIVTFGTLFIVFIVVMVMAFSSASKYRSSYATNATSAVPTYRILNEHHNDVLKKCNVDIEIKEKLSEDQLKILANDLHKDRLNFKRTYIGIYLPGMKVNAGSWATATYLPDLQVEIIGSIK